MRKPLPKSENSLLLRTDFSKDSAWIKLRSASEALSEEGFQANLTVIDDVEYEGLSVAQLIELKPIGEQRGEHSFAFLADTTSFTNPEHPILVVELRETPGQTFRVIPSELWSVENNLALGNMDYKDFAQSVDADGVFRGWPK